MAHERIMIVEDEAVISMDIESTLTALGYQVVAAAATGAVAIERALSVRPDLMLMDIMLRGPMDGVEAAERIRALLDVPIIYLTAYATDETLQRAKLTQPFGYLLKPFEERDLRTAIELALYTHQMSAQLRDSEARFRLLAENSTDLITRHAPDGRYLYVSPASRQLLGYEPDVLAETALLDLVHPDDVPAVQRALFGMLAGADVHTLEFRARCVDGFYLWLETTGHAVRDAATGKVVEVQATSRDISARKVAELALRESQAEQVAIAAENVRLYQEVRGHAAELEQKVAERTAELLQREAALREANEKLRELDRLKSQFIAGISHELRTPLTNIKLYASLLERGKPEKQAQYLATLQDEAEVLHRLIEQLLSVARAEAGHPLALARVDLNQMLNDLAVDWCTHAARRDIRLQVRGSTSVPAVMADRLMIAQVFDSLVTNALSYTPPGGEVTVCVHDGRTPGPCGEGFAAREDRPSPADGWVACMVRDTGPGIGLADLPHIFDRFYRGEAALRAGYPGAGLGLAMCREIVQQHGGRLTVDSEPGRGSLFTLWLRLSDVSRHATVGPARLTLEPDRGRGAR
jgi:PAS domain S-box-containing protein